MRVRGKQQHVTSEPEKIKTEDVCMFGTAWNLGENTKQADKARDVSGGGDRNLNSSATGGGGEQTKRRRSEPAHRAEKLGPKAYIHDGGLQPGPGDSELCNPKKGGIAT